MSFSFSVTEEDVLENLPSSAELSPEVRALLVQGLNELPGRPVQSPDISGQVGVILGVTAKDDDPAKAVGFIIPRAECVAKLREIAGVSAETIDCVENGANMPGYLDVVAIMGTGPGSAELVFAIPMLSIRISFPGEA